MDSPEVYSFLFTHNFRILSTISVIEKKLLPTRKYPFNLEREKYICIFLIKPEADFKRLSSLTFGPIESEKCSVINLKVFQLVHEILAKNRFSAAISNFPDKNGSRFFQPLYCTDHYY